MSEPPKDLVIFESWYYSQQDEDAFFSWLDKIEHVVSYQGGPRGLVAVLKDGPIDDNSLRELIALHYRYKLYMKRLAAFETDENRKWFRNSRAYWYSRVFKKERPRKSELR